MYLFIELLYTKNNYLSGDKYPWPWETKEERGSNVILFLIKYNANVVFIHLICPKDSMIICIIINVRKYNTPRTHSYRIHILSYTTPLERIKFPLNLMHRSRWTVETREYIRPVEFHGAQYYIQECRCTSGFQYNNF